MCFFVYIIVISFILITVVYLFNCLLIPAYCVSLFFFFPFSAMDSIHHQHHSADEEEEEEEEGYDDEPRAHTTKRTMEEEEGEEIYSGVEGQYNLCSGCSDIYLPFQSCT